MKQTKKAMRAEAVELMKILGVDGEFIMEFEKSKQVMVSDQQFLDVDPEGMGNPGEATPFFPNGISVNGKRYLVFTATPSEESVQIIRELETEKNVIVYHVLRIETNDDDDNDNRAIYVFFTVDTFVGDWKGNRKSAASGMPYAFQSTFGFPCEVDYLEYGAIPVKPYLGCLAATNVR